VALNDAVRLLPVASHRGGAPSAYLRSGSSELKTHSFSHIGTSEATPMSSSIISWIGMAVRQARLRRPR